MRLEREYLFFRHAEAENQAPAFEEELIRDSAGRADYPLSNAGREQAVRAGKRARTFGADLLLSSSLRRAKETAAIIGHEADLPVSDEDPDLDEVNPGRSSFKSLSFRDRELAIASLAIVAAFLFDRRVAARRSGESAPELLARIQRAFARLDRLDAQRVVIVSHGYWIFTAALLVAPSATLRRARMVEHCSATLIAKDTAGELHLLSLADV